MSWLEDRSEKIKLQKISVIMVRLDMFLNQWKCRHSKWSWECDKCTTK